MDWTMGSFIDEACARVRQQVGDEKVVLGLSGGVDSSVAAALLHKAIGDQLTCIFVNNGLLRENEAEIVQRVFGRKFSDQTEIRRCLGAFSETAPGRDRPGNETQGDRRANSSGCSEEATEELLAQDRADKRPHAGYRFLAQGTLYPDVIESVAIGGNPASLIKSHHNVGGLPEKMNFELVEPLRQLFKDEVRQAGLQLGLPNEIVHRQPFPGPGLAVRILGEVTPERLRILREADTIVVSEMKASDWYYRVWQSFAVLLPVRSVGVMGDQRTYENTIALRIVESQDGMTADWVRLPYEMLARISSRIVQRSQRRQPRLLRHFDQATEHDRVGVRRRVQELLGCDPRSRHPSPRPPRNNRRDRARDERRHRAFRYRRRFHLRDHRARNARCRLCA